MTNNSGYLDKQTRDNLKPKEVYEKLTHGNERFFKGEVIARDKAALFEGAALGQTPMAYILSCIDSRAPVERLFDLDAGDVFVGRVAGNVINPDRLASMEYACHVAGAKLIVVMGHSDCGAVKSAIADVKLGNITQLLAKVKPAIDKAATDELADVTAFNVAQSMAEIYQQSTLLKEMIDNGDIAMIGAIYDVASGKVSFNNYSDVLHAFLGDNKPRESLGALV